MATLTPNPYVAMAKTGVHPVVLTIAGSDSGGGAGIQTDVKTITILGGFATTVITSLTAQNGLGVQDVLCISPEFVQKQLQSVESGFPITAAKTGMLASAEIIEILATSLANKTYPLVVDPVCMSHSGHSLLPKLALDNFKKYMVPLADVITPNVPEAEWLTGLSITSSADVEKPIHMLLNMGAKSVLLKGGHLPEFENTPFITDWLGFADGSILPLQHPWVKTTNTHGTGCMLAAALATGIGYGFEVKEAVVQAQQLLSKALAASFSPGLGYGPPYAMVVREKL